MKIAHKQYTTVQNLCSKFNFTIKLRKPPSIYFVPCNKFCTKYSLLITQRVIESRLRGYKCNKNTKLY